jgi:hypothetical protein
MFLWRLQQTMMSGSNAAKPLHLVSRAAQALPKHRRGSKPQTLWAMPLLPPDSCLAHAANFGQPVDRNVISVNQSPAPLTPHAITMMRTALMTRTRLSVPLARGFADADKSMFEKAKETIGKAMEYLARAGTCPQQMLVLPSRAL